MVLSREQLLKIAREDPFRMFTGEELALLCQVSHDVVTKVKLAEDSPFVISKCRPEWFVEWLRVHPGFQLSKDPNLRPAKKNRSHPVANYRGLSEPVATGRKSASAGKKRVIPQAHENHLTSLLQTVLECLQTGQPGLCPAPAARETDGGVKTIKEQLKLEALDHPLDRVPLVHTAADGEAWIGKGEGCECRIIFPAPRLLNVVDETHANFAAIKSITRKHFPELFQKLTIYELIDRTHFRENVAKKFGDLQSNQLLSLCSVPSEPKATWKNTLTDEKKNVRGACHE